ncbi:MAG: hypothetical protein ACJAR3_002275 [Roseivirga sp.]|jgi:hypothetical protein
MIQCRKKTYPVIKRYGGVEVIPFEVENQTLQKPIQLQMSWPDKKKTRNA